MLKALSLAIFIALCSISSYAQTDTTFFDAFWERSTKDNAVYFRPYPQKVDNDHYLVKDYYIYNGQLQMECTSFDDSAYMLDGDGKYYYLNGTLKDECSFKDGERHGRFKKFASNGKLIFTGKYKQGLLSGDVVGYDSLSGIKSFEGDYFNGNRDYWFTWYYADGVRVKRLVKYIGGRIKKAYCFSDRREPLPFDSVYTIPISHFGYADYYDYFIHDNNYIAFRKKHKNSNICLHVKVFFDQTGEVKKWVLENNNTKEYQDFARNIFLKFPNVGDSIYDMDKEDGFYSELMHFYF